jgi:hypothetical protein
VNGEIERMPETELASDCMLPEGPPDNFEIMNELLNAIPRDADYNSELWTTVDKVGAFVPSPFAFMRLCVYEGGLFSRTALMAISPFVGALFDFGFACLTFPNS